MRVWLTILAFLATSSTAFAMGCPSLTYGQVVYAPIGGTNLLPPANCLFWNDIATQPQCQCASALFPDSNASGCQGPLASNFTALQPRTVFITVPQVRNATGMCVPQYGLAQPPINDLSRTKATAPARVVAPAAPAHLDAPARVAAPPRAFAAPHMAAPRMPEFHPAPPQHIR